MNHQDRRLMPRRRVGRALRSWLMVPLVALLGLLVIPGQAQAVIGGTEVDAPQPWIVSVQQPDGAHVCTASLIGRKWVLMANHCTLAGDDLQVRVGSLDRTDGGEVVPVKEMHSHPDAPGSNSAGVDLALVELVRPVRVTPIELATESPENGSPLRAMGWGYTCYEGGCPLPERLREMTLPIDADSCDRPVSRTLCVSDKETGAAPGDSGGPALTETADGWRLVGVTNGGGKNMETGEYLSVYTNLTSQLEWIRTTMSE